MGASHSPSACSKSDDSTTPFGPVMVKSRRSLNPCSLSSLTFSRTCTRVRLENFCVRVPLFRLIVKLTSSSAFASKKREKAWTVGSDPQIGQKGPTEVAYTRSPIAFCETATAHGRPSGQLRIFAREATPEAGGRSIRGRAPRHSHPNRNYPEL